MQTIVISNDDGIYEGNVWELRKVIFSLFEENGINKPRIIMLVPFDHASAQSCYRSTIDDGKTRDELLNSVKKFKSVKDFNSQNTKKLQINDVIQSNKEFGYNDIYYFDERPADMSEIFNHHKYFNDIQKVDLLISGPNNVENQTHNHIIQAGTIGLINVALTDNSEINKFQNSLPIAISNVSGTGLNANNIADNYHHSKYINKFAKNIKTIINDALEKKNYFGEKLNDNILNYNFPMEDSIKKSTSNEQIKSISDTNDVVHHSTLQVLSVYRKTPIIFRMDKRKILPYEYNDHLTKEINNLNDQNETISEVPIDSKKYTQSNTNEPKVISSQENNITHSNGIISYFHSLTNCFRARDNGKSNPEENKLIKNNVKNPKYTITSYKGAWPLFCETKSNIK